MKTTVNKATAWDACIAARKDERVKIARWLHFCADVTNQIDSAELHRIAEAVEQGVHKGLKL